MTAVVLTSWHVCGTVTIQPAAEVGLHVARQPRLLGWSSVSLQQNLQGSALHSWRRIQGHRPARTAAVNDTWPTARLGVWTTIIMR
jgi:hypothetical protein